MYIHIYTLHIYTHIHTYIHIYTYIHTCICVCMHACIYINKYIYINIYIYIYYIHIYTNLHTHTHTILAPPLHARGHIQYVPVRVQHVWACIHVHTKKTYVHTCPHIHSYTFQYTHIHVPLAPVFFNMLGHATSAAKSVALRSSLESIVNVPVLCVCVCVCVCARARACVCMQQEQRSLSRCVAALGPNMHLPCLCTDGTLPTPITLHRCSKNEYVCMYLYLVDLALFDLYGSQGTRPHLPPQADDMLSTRDLAASTLLHLELYG